MGQSASTPIATAPTEFLLADSEARRQRARELRNQADEQYLATVEAWDAGERSSAASHKMRRQQLQRDADALDEEAADLAFRYYNVGYAGQNEEWGRIDLHGLRTHEALAKVKAHLVEAKKRATEMGIQKGSVDVITGKGNRSKNGIAVIKPRVEEWCSMEGMKVEQPKNTGLLIVHFDAPEGTVKQEWVGWLIGLGRAILGIGTGNN
ncbi:MAG: hypothetical protein M1821_009004 [Bathelium mastoideum]|nr:MAG: hypothetical protein M1821_009004 [Bathelium mastoideum]